MNRLSVIPQCPYCHKDETIVSSLEDKSFCLEELPNGDCVLRRSHAYYYQVLISVHVLFLSLVVHK